MPRTPDPGRSSGVRIIQDRHAVTRVFLSLGSNLGDRLAYLRAALEALGEGPSITLVGTSRVYETEPVEVEEEQPDYLNCVAEIDCGLPAIGAPPLLPGRRERPGARARPSRREGAADA